MSKFYYCYSYPLKMFLIGKNEPMLASSIHPKTHKKFWMFERTNSLDSALAEWTDKNKKRTM